MGGEALSCPEPQTPSPMPASDKPADPLPLESTDAWLKRAIKTMDRMARDEEYRKEIAKRLF